MIESHANSEAPPAEALERFSLARTAIPMYWPFLSQATYRVAPRWTRQLQTLAVDKFWRLYLNPDFVLRNKPLDLALLIAGHELQHLLLNHPYRLTEYNDQVLLINGQPIALANVANDLAINTGLPAFAAAGLAYRASRGKTAGNLEAPEYALYPAKFQDKHGNVFPEGLISEDYAALLIVNAQPSKGGGGKSKKGSESDPGSRSDKADPGSGSGSGQGNDPACGQCGSGAGGPAGEWEDATPAEIGDYESGVTPEEAEVLRQHTAEAIRDQAEKSRGTVPGGLALWAEIYLTPPKIDWRKQLRCVVRAGVNWAMGRVDYSYARPNRRNIASRSRIILPGLYRPEPRIGVLLDTSGSMQKPDYEIAFAEIQGILKTCGLPRIPFVAADAALYEIQHITSLDDIELTGGGGTSLDVCIPEAIEQLDIHLLVAITDGYTPWPQEPIPGVRVVAVLTHPEPDNYRVPDWITAIEACD